MHVQMGPLVCVGTLTVLISGASDLHPSGHEVSLDICAITSFDNGHRPVFGHWERQQSNGTLELTSILLHSRERVRHRHK